MRIRLSPCKVSFTGVILLHSGRWSHVPSYMIRWGPIVTRERLVDHRRDSFPRQVSEHTFITVGERNVLIPPSSNVHKSRFYGTNYTLFGPTYTCCSRAFVIPVVSAASSKGGVESPFLSPSLVKMICGCLCRIRMSHDESHYFRFCFISSHCSLTSYSYLYKKYIFFFHNNDVSVKISIYYLFFSLR